jgi:PPK2 family polyphosphate:nucleotide phosphotransferase
MEQLRVGPSFDLRSVDTRSTPGFQGDKAAGESVLKNERDELAELQEKLFASGKFGDERRVLLVLQAMDTAGKGGVVKHVVGSVDPQGVDITAFKAPTDEEKAHDFLWRVERRLPAAGMIGVFDRSHYEDVLIHRVHGLSEPDAIEERYGRIVEFEQKLVASGTTLVKVMLHISPAEQKKRLKERLQRPDKHWKFNPGDITERARWEDYMTAYQIAIERTHTDEAPWHVVPADRKWFARLAVHRLLLGALRSLGQDWPKADYDVDAELRKLAAT